MIVGPFLVSSKILKIFIFEKWSSADWVFFENYISIGRFRPI